MTDQQPSPTEETEADTSPGGVDPDAPGSTLFDEGEDAVEPNEPA